MFVWSGPGTCRRRRRCWSMPRTTESRWSPSTARPGVTARYMCPHAPADGGELPSASVHGRPGPSHVTGAEPSPGSNTNAVGVAVTVADTPRSSTVRAKGCHSPLQKNVQRPTQV